MDVYHTVSQNNKKVVLCKLGTASNMQYVRREEAYIIRSFDIEPKLKFLFMDIRLIWRFRWPDEDVLINYTNNESFKQSYKNIVDAVGKRVIRSLAFTANFKQDYSNDQECKEQGQFRVEGDRHSTNSGFRTVFSCLNCGKLSAFSKVEIENTVKPAILSLENYPKDFLEQVIERIYYHSAV